MRRGGHNYHLRAPWRPHNDPTPSSVPIEQFGAHTLRLLIALAAFSIAILIIIWNSRHHVSIHDLQPRDQGFVFPLYHGYYNQFPNASEGEMWHKSSATNHGRGLQAVRHPFFKLREYFFIEMKLGVHAKKFYFNIDTGSKHSWVYCKLPGHQSILGTLGPNGMFEARSDTVVKCVGDDSNLCHELQYTHVEPCDWDHDFECLIGITYADSSHYAGAFVLESLKLPTRGHRDVKVNGLFGCITRKKFIGERPQIFHDGLIGLGNCKMTLIDQWLQRNIIHDNVVALCIARAVKRGFFGIKDRMGYVAIGVDYKEKFDKGNIYWAKLRECEGVDCSVSVSLLYLIFKGKHITPKKSLSTKGNEIFVLDTGTDLTYLDIAFYDPLINDLDEYAMEKGYFATADDFQFIESDRRQCWSTSEDVVISPIHNFPLLTFAIKGMPSDPKDSQIRYLTILPENYLNWEENKKVLCVNIICSSELTRGESILGAGQLREQLFVIDYENQRIRWQPSACELL